jgi:hypothetical protein
VVDEITPQEFRCSVRRDKSNYTDLKDDMYFNVGNRGFVATAFMHHTHNGLDEKYVPKTANEIHVFWEIQRFMYTPLRKISKPKSLVCEY